MPAICVRRDVCEVDETYFNLLPTGRSEITAEEAHELAVIFGKDGELAAERLS
jgi:hypothetical protein